MKSVFKIRRVDGLFSLGGNTPKWGKIGKAWTSEAALRGHLTMVRDSGPYGESEAKKDKRLANEYLACEIVRFDVVEAEEKITVLAYDAARRKHGNS